MARITFPIIERGRSVREKNERQSKPSNEMRGPELPRKASHRDLVSIHERDARVMAEIAKQRKAEDEKSARLRAERIERFGDHAWSAKVRQHSYIPQRQAASAGPSHRLIFRLTPVPEKAGAAEWRASQLPPTILWVSAASSEEARRFVALTTATGSAPRANVLKASPWMSEGLVECSEDIADHSPEPWSIRLASGTQIGIPRWARGA